MTAIPKPSARLTVKVVPGSSRDQIVGWLGDALKQPAGSVAAAGS